MTKTKTKNATITLALAASLMALGALSSASARAGKPNGAAPAKAGTPTAKTPQVARGEYLVNTSACHDCHTPLKMGPKGPEPDMSRMLSGHPESLDLPPPPQLPPGPWLVTVAATNTGWAGPWGVSFTANLTPDKETGIGQWNARTFIETIRNGRHMGRGRPLLPPMPWPVYRAMTDEDLEAIFAYLQTIPAIKNRVPQPRPPEPIAQAKP